MGAGQIDLASYRVKREAGIITPIRIGDTFAVLVKQWNENLWKEDNPQIVAVSLQSLLDQKQALLNSIKAIDEFIIDLEALPKSE
uniref:Uncharacterized protein n=1 Tax=viral metagenome TaxID=1070528 RepID=A0A6M3LK07_9ZZZZ